MKTDQNQIYLRCRLCLRIFDASGKEAAYKPQDIAWQWMGLCTECQHEIITEHGKEADTVIMNIINEHKREEAANNPTSELFNGLKDSFLKPLNF